MTKALPRPRKEAESRAFKILSSKEYINLLLLCFFYIFAFNINVMVYHNPIKYDRKRIT